MVIYSTLWIWLHYDYDNDNECIIQNFFYILLMFFLDIHIKINKSWNNKGQKMIKINYVKAIN